MKDDAGLSHRLDRHREREEEFLARRTEAGDDDAARRLAAKRARFGMPMEEELESGPTSTSETRQADVPPEGGRSRAQSTVTMESDQAPSTAACQTDLPEDVDIDVPVPVASDAGQAGHSRWPGWPGLARPDWLNK